MNRVKLQGQLTRLPELKIAAGGKPLCEMHLAIPRHDGETPFFVDVDAFGGLAEVCAHDLRSGHQVEVSGRLDHSLRKNLDGTRPREAHRVIATGIHRVDTEAYRDRARDWADRFYSDGHPRDPAEAF